ncbi:MAG: hypothetical protein WC048_16230 [Rhizobium sp.]|jgi:hypothetical protein
MEKLQSHRWAHRQFGGSETVRQWRGLEIGAGPKTGRAWYQKGKIRNKVAIAPSRKQMEIRSREARHTVGYH